MTADFTDELVRVSRLFGLYERDAVCCGTVTVAQCLALQLLRGGPLENTALAESSGVSPSASTRLVDGLVKKGWVERQRGEADRRQVRISLTESGAEEAGRLRQLTEAAVGAVLDHVPAARREDVLDAVRLLRGALEKAGANARCC